MSTLLSTSPPADLAPRRFGEGQAWQIAFIGAGKLAETLGLAMLRIGVAVDFIASRNRNSAVSLATRFPSCRHVAIQEAAELANLIFLSVPDDEIEAVANACRWRPGQVVAHCSGGTDLGAIDAARKAGAHVGGFHPLQVCSVPTVAAQSLAGCGVAIEGDSAAREVLCRLAEQLALKIIYVPTGARAAYHGGANLAASLLLVALREATQLWMAVGVDGEAARMALLSLARNALETAENGGIDDALSGPIRRGDAGTLARHLEAIGDARPGLLSLYKDLARRQCLALFGDKPWTRQERELFHLLEIQSTVQPSTR